MGGSRSENEQVERMDAKAERVTRSAEAIYMVRGQNVTKATRLIGATPTAA